MIVGASAALGAVLVADDQPSATATPRSTTTTASATTSTTARPAPTTTVAPTTTTIPVMADPPFVVLPAISGRGLGPGSRGDDVRSYEEWLSVLHFDPGPVDGVYDSKTRSAVEALQKLFGMPRNGRIGQAEAFTLMAFHYPDPLAGPDREPTRIEIDLDRQVLILWVDHQIRLISPTSTGNGEHFCGGDDGCQYAVTPAGKYAVQWEYPGWKKGKLGTLYNPVYFNGGIAVHGYTSVPTYPASHGCARVPMHIAEYFQSLVSRGDAVYVIGTPRGPAAGSGPPPPPPTAATTTAPTSSVAPTTAGPTTTAVSPTTTPPTTAAPTTVAPTTTIPATTSTT